MLEKLRQLLKILGNVSLEEAATWLEVEENARQLLAEGHAPTDETENKKKED